MELKQPARAAACLRAAPVDLQLVITCVSEEATHDEQAQKPVRSSVKKTTHPRRQGNAKWDHYLLLILHLFDRP